MRTRSSSNLIVESFTIPKRRNRRCSKQIVKPELRTIVETPVATMADTRTMSELLQAPTEGYRDEIVLPPILAKNFELKVGLLQLVTSSQFHSFERDDPHSHIRWFNKITSTLKYKNVPHEAIKLMLFPFSLERAARIWLEPRSIHTWEDLSKVHTSRNKPVVSKATTTSSSTPAYLPEITALTDAVKAIASHNKILNQHPVKDIEKNLCYLCVDRTYYSALAKLPRATLLMLLQPQGPTIKEVSDTVLKGKLIIVLAIK
ncbi:hypothetical protein Tco_1369568 [Tanacetum coccineum]